MTQIDPINKAIKTKLLKALKSGKYKQIGNRLRQHVEKDQQHMCLFGVLCDIYIEEQKKGSWRVIANKKDDASGIVEYSFDLDKIHFVEQVPTEVAEWAGFTIVSIARLVTINDAECLNRRIGDFKKVIEALEQWPTK